MFIVKIIVGIPFALGLFFLISALTDPVRSVDDLKMERVEYSDAYIRDVGISPRTFKIEIDSGGKILSLFPNMLPEGKTPDQVVELLSRSREAVVWLERQNDLIIVKGIRTEFLNIPPSRGVRLHERNRKAGVWFGGGFFLAGLFVYIYFKRYFDLDWKLSTKE